MFVNNRKNGEIMYTKEEAKALRVSFWDGFKQYCRRNRIYRKWVLTGVRIKSVQLKFHADDRKALVLFQIDHRNDLRRYEVYECFLSYQTLFRQEAGDDLLWDEDYTGIEGCVVSAVYFELPGVSVYCPADWERIYAFFVAKMPLLESLYFDYRDVITARLKEGD